MLTVEKVKALEIFLKDLNGYMFEFVDVINGAYNRPTQIWVDNKNTEDFNFINAFEAYSVIHKHVQGYLSDVQETLAHYHHLDHLFQACFSMDGGRMYDSKSNEALRFFAEATLVSASIGRVIAATTTIHTLDTLDKRNEVASASTYGKIINTSKRIHEKLLVVLTRVELMVEIINPPESDK